MNIFHRSTGWRKSCPMIITGFKQNKSILIIPSILIRNIRIEKDMLQNVYKNRGFSRDVNAFQFSISIVIDTRARRDLSYNCDTSDPDRQNVHQTERRAIQLLWWKSFVDVKLRMSLKIVSIGTQTKSNCKMRGVIIQMITHIHDLTSRQLIRLRQHFLWKHLNFGWYFKRYNELPFQLSNFSFHAKLLHVAISLMQVSTPVI